MDMKNQLTNALEELAFLGEVLGENPFKIRAFQNAARILSKLEGDLGELYHSGELKKTKGIGKGILALAEDLVSNGSVSDLADARAKLPSGIFEVARIPGLGPKRVKTLWQELEIGSLSELEYACNENRLLGLKGFGPKMQNEVLANIAHVKSTQGHFRLDKALEFANDLKANLQKCEDILNIQLVGDLRRHTETVSSIEFLVLGSVSKIESFLQATKFEETSEGLPQIKIHLTENKARFGALTLEHTGPEAYYKKLESRIKELDAENEAKLFEALNLVPNEPEHRSESTPLITAGKAYTPLIKRADLKGAFHNHTVASDGANTIEEMRAAAIKMGLEYLGISDHSKSAFYASGLADNELLAQVTTLTKLNQDEWGEKCFLFSGVESDILGDGALDYDDTVLEKLDVVIGSVHSRLKQNPEEMTKRMVNAALNPFTKIIGHPTGRLILGRKPSEFDMSKLIAACAKSGTVLELNANPHRLDLHEFHLAQAKEAGVKIAISADAHSTNGLSDLDFGIFIAKRAGLVADDVINTRTLAETKEWAGLI